MDRQALITQAYGVYGLNVCRCQKPGVKALVEINLCKVNRPGIDKLMGYIRGSDFYTAPASTKFHLSCEGGLPHVVPGKMDIF